MSATRVPAAQFPRSTFADLSTAMGVHRNTCTAWAAEGAPPGPPYCELAWRTWAAAQGKTVSKAPEQALLELLAGAGVAEYRRQLESQRGQVPAGPAGQQSTQAVDWDQENKRLQAEQRQMEIDKAKRRLISIEDLHRLVEGLATAGASVLNDAPRLVEVLPLGPDDRHRCQAAIEGELAKRRARLVEDLRARLREFLEHAP